MSLKSSYPVLLDNIAIPFGKGWSETSNVVENTMESESGTTMRIVTRYDKLTISYSATVLDDMASTLKELSERNVLTLKKYNIKSKAYEERSVVIRGFSASLLDGSDGLSATNGVWKVSFNIEEL